MGLRLARSSKKPAPPHLRSIQGIGREFEERLHEKGIRNTNDLLALLRGKRTARERRELLKVYLRNFSNRSVNRGAFAGVRAFAAAAGVPVQNMTR